MSIPSATALKNRARALLEAMGERERWVYAVPPDAAEAVRASAAEAGLRAAGDEGFEAEGGAKLVFRADPELEVGLLEAQGAAAVPALSKVLDRVGFFAQSQLLAVAYDVADAEAPTALRTLAYMVSTWGEPWPELFSLHLGASDPKTRALAARSLAVAAERSGAAQAARSLLEGAMAAEADEATREAMRQALAGL